MKSIRFCAIIASFVASAFLSCKYAMFSRFLAFFLLFLLPIMNGSCKSRESKSDVKTVESVNVLFDPKAGKFICYLKCADYCSNQDGSEFAEIADCSKPIGEYTKEYCTVSKKGAEYRCVNPTLYDLPCGSRPVPLEIQGYRYSFDYKKGEPGAFDPCSSWVWQFQTWLKENPSARRLFASGGTEKVPVNILFSQTREVSYRRDTDHILKVYGAEPGNGYSWKSETAKAIAPFASAEEQGDQEQWVQQSATPRRTWKLSSTRLYANEIACDAGWTVASIQEGVAAMNEALSEPVLSGPAKIIKEKQESVWFSDFKEKTDTIKEKAPVVGSTTVCEHVKSTVYRNWGRYEGGNIVIEDGDYFAYSYSKGTKLDYKTDSTGDIRKYFCAPIDASNLINRKPGYALCFKKM